MIMVLSSEALRLQLSLSIALTNPTVELEIWPRPMDYFGVL